MGALPFGEGHWMIAVSVGWTKMREADGNADVYSLKPCRLGVYLEKISFYEMSSQKESAF